RGVAMETLRRYPVAPVLMATAARPFAFAGCRVEAGEPITVATTLTHFLPELLRDPYRFDIDRYAPPRSEHKQSGAFAPFGLGTHTCLGAGIAEIQAMLIPAALFHEADFALEPPDYLLRVRPDPTLTAGDSFKLGLLRWRTNT